MIQHKVVWHDNEAAAGLSSKRGYDSLDFGIATGARCDRLHVGRPGRSLEIAEVIGPAPWRRVAIEQHSDALQADLSEQLATQLGQFYTDLAKETFKSHQDFASKVTPV